MGSLRSGSSNRPTRLPSFLTRCKDSARYKVYRALLHLGFSPVPDFQVFEPPVYWLKKLSGQVVIFCLLEKPVKKLLTTRKSVIYCYLVVVTTSHHYIITDLFLPPKTIHKLFTSDLRRLFMGALDKFGLDVLRVLSHFSMHHIVCPIGMSSQYPGTFLP